MSKKGKSRHAREIARQLGAMCHAPHDGARVNGGAVGFQRIVVQGQGVWGLLGRWKCTVVLVEESTATTAVLLGFKSSVHSDRGTTPQHPERTTAG